jgi:hypothetical protein
MNNPNENPEAMAVATRGERAKQKADTAYCSPLAPALQSIRHHLLLLAACVLLPIGWASAALLIVAWEVLS